MKSLKVMSVIAAVSAMLVVATSAMLVVATSAMLVVATGDGLQAASQQPPTAPPAGVPPPPGTPPAAQKPPAAPPAAAPQPPRPFPEGAKVAFVDIQLIASNSVEGKAATGKLDAFSKKTSETLQAKNTALKALQDKLTSGGSVMNDQARAQLEKEIEKGQRDLQFAQQDAQSELTDMRNQLMAEFQENLNPIIEQVRAEKGLLMVFSIRDAAIVAVDLGLDLSAEVIKRFDAAAKTPPAPKK